MALTIKRAAYYHVNLQDEAGGAYRLLAGLASNGVNLLAFNTTPVGPHVTHLMLFPADTSLFEHAIKSSGANATGPQHALLIQGDDELGAAANIHQRLAEAEVTPFASGGVSDGRGGFGYLVYVRADDFERAAAALGV